MGVLPIRCKGYGLERTLTVECIFGNQSHRRGNHNGLKLGRGNRRVECTRSDYLQALGKFKRLKGKLYKRQPSDPLQAALSFFERHRLKPGLVEDVSYLIVRFGADLCQTGREFDRLQGSGVLECIVAEAKIFCPVRRKRKRSQLGTSVECICADCRNRCGNFNCLNSRASGERIFTDRHKRGRKLNDRQRNTIFKRIGADLRDSFGKDDFTQLGTVAEDTAVDCLHGCREGNSHERSAAVKSARSDQSDRRRNFNLLNARSRKCIRSDRCNAAEADNLRQRTVHVERVIFYCVESFGKRERCDHRAVRKGILGNRQFLIALFLKDHVGEHRAAIECVGLDHRDVLADRDAFKRCIARKCLFSDRRHCVGKRDRHFTADLRIIQKLPLSLCIQNAADALIYKVGRINGDSLEVITACKHVYRIKGNDRRRQRHVCQRHTVRERTLTDSDLFLTSAELNILKLIAALECVGSDRSDRTGHHDFLNGFAIRKCRSADGCDIVTPHDLGKRCAVIECIIADLHFGRNCRTREEFDLVELSAICKCIRTDGCKICVECNFGQIVTIFKRICADRRNLARNCNRTRFSERAKQDRRFAVSDIIDRRPDDTAKKAFIRNIECVPLFHIDIGKVGAAEEYLIRLKLRRTLRNGEFLKIETILECKIFNRQRLDRRAVRRLLEYHIPDRTAVECRRTDKLNIGRYGDRRDVGTRKCTQRNLLDTVGNSVCSAAARRIICNTGQMRLRIIVQQNAVHRRIIDVMISLDRINIDVHQVVASREHTRRIGRGHRADHLNGIRNFDAFKPE